MAEMTLLEAIQARHSVRKYKDEPIPEEVLAVLRNKVWEINRQAGLHIQLVTGEPKAFSGILLRSEELPGNGRKEGRGSG